MDTNNLIGLQQDISTTGITNLTITIGGNSTEGTFQGTQEIILSDGTDIKASVTHNFSSSALNMSNIKIESTPTSFVISFSGQLLEDEYKTVYITDNSFVKLCVKDEEITTQAQISTDCTGTNETDFTSCLGASNITINNITCSDLGSTIKIEWLKHSGIKGTQTTQQATQTATTGGNRGGGSGYPQTICEVNWSCTEWTECRPEGKRYRTCYDSNECVSKANVYIKEQPRPAETTDCQVITKTEKTEQEDLEQAAERQPSIIYGEGIYLKKDITNKIYEMGIILAIIILSISSIIRYAKKPISITITKIKKRREENKDRVKIKF